MKSFFLLIISLFILLFSNKTFGQLTAQISVVQSQCPGVPTGEITVTPSGAIGPFTISIIIPYASFGPAYQLVTAPGAYTFTGVGPGNYTVMISANGSGCETITKQAFIIETGNFFGYVLQNDSTCGPCDAILTAAFDPPSSYTYNWSNGQTSPVIKNLCDGNYTVTVTSTAGCTKQISTLVTNIEPEIEISSEFEGCQFEDFHFSISESQTTTGSCIAINPDSAQWNFGDGETGTGLEVAHAFQTTGNFQVTLTTNGGLSTSRFVTISQGQYSISATPVCGVSNTALFSFTETCMNFNDFEWNFGDPNSPNNTSTDQNPLHVFTAPGTYTVTLSMDGQTQTTTVDVVQNPSADSYILTTQGNCNNPFNRQFYGIVNCYENALWNFGDPASGTANTSTLFNGGHVFSAAGTYTVTLLANAGIFSEVTKTITVIVDAPATHVPAPNASIVSIGGTVNIGSPPAPDQNYFWNTGTTSSMATVNKPGIYFVRVTRQDSPNSCFLFDTVLVNYCGNFVLENEDKIEKESLSLYPNPAKSVLYARFQTPGTYQIFEPGGKAVLVGKAIENDAVIDIRSLPAGLYFFQLQTVDGNRLHSRFLVE